MKRVIIITLFCFLIALKGKAQIYFNKRFDVANKSNGTLSFKLYNDTFYLATQIAETPAPNLSYKSSLLKVDMLGNIVNQKRFKNANQYYTSSLDVTKINNSYYQCGNTGSGIQDRSSILKFNETGDTIHTFIYGDTSYYVNTSKIIPYTKTKNQLLIIGTTDSTCGSGHQSTYKPIIRVLDTNGVLMQTKLYLSNCYYRNITGLDTSENKGFLIAYGGYYNTWDAEARILKLDSNLNVIWNKQINTVSGGACTVLNHKNQFYIGLSTHVDSVWNFSYKWGRVSLTKLDLNGNTIWQKNYGIKERPMLPSAIKECKNGDFIMSGTRQTSPYELQGWIMRTDSVGNLKWWHNYRPDTTPLDTSADNYLYDIIELPNKDIAAVGWAGATSLNSLQQTWLLKVDSNGCFGIGNCPQNLTTGINQISNNDEYILKIHPNPFTNNITVNYTLHNLNKPNVEISLIEVESGKLISKQNSTKNSDIIQFNTEDLDAGVYIINISNNGMSISNNKVLNIK
jgi:hypothetical protein